MNRTARWVLGLAVLGWVTVGCSESSNPVGISSPAFDSDGVTLAATSETINFEGVAAGTQNPVVFGDLGSGPIATSAGPATASCPDADTAIIYDTSAGPGADPDLDNQSAQANVLIVEEDLADTDGDGDPDDCFNGGNLTIDFSGVDAAGVTVNSVKVLDIEQQAGNTIDLLGPGDAPITLGILIPFTGDGGITGPINLGPTAGVTKMVFHFVTSGAVDDIVFTPPDRGGEGCTPGYYKNLRKHAFAWADAGWDPNNDIVSDMFSEAANAPYAALGNASLHEGLSFQGGNSVAEKAEILLRAAIAAVLNADNPNVSYAFSSAQIIADVNAALASQDISTILSLASDLDDENNAGCPLGNS